MPRGYEPSQPLVLDELHSITDEDQHFLNYSERTSWAVFHSKRSIAEVHADLTVLLLITFGNCQTYNVIS